MALEQYFARLQNLSLRQVHASLDKVTSEFQQPAQQWHLLQFLRSTLDPVMVYAAPPMRLGSPVTATVGDPATPATPTILTPRPAPLLNFRYGAPRTARGAAVGLGKHGPYDRDSTDRHGQLGRMAPARQGTSGLPGPARADADSAATGRQGRSPLVSRLGHRRSWLHTTRSTMCILMAWSSRARSAPARPADGEPAS